MDTTFPHSYEIEQLTETPGVASLRHYYYPGGSTAGGRDGILVKVSPKGAQPWFGTFAFGHIAPTGASGVFTMPDPHQMCVVARGQGYLLSPDSPTSWDQVRVTPIIEVHPIRAQGIVVFADFTRLVAYSATGIKWATKRLAWDCLKITKVSDDFIRGEYWDIQSEAMAQFVVDLTDGSHQGGMEEPL
jgi:hypothetical protein